MRVQKSGLADITADEAMDIAAIKESFLTGRLPAALLKGIEGGMDYLEEIRTIYLMRIDYELFQGAVETLEDRDAKLFQMHVVDGLYYKEIGDKDGQNAESVRKRMQKLRNRLRDETVSLLELNCWK